jgi:hypothetical protein
MRPRTLSMDSVVGYFPLKVQPVRSTILTVRLLHRIIS